MKLTDKELERFNKHSSELPTTNGCVIWTGPRDKDGYGRLWRDGGRSYLPAHTVSWLLANDGPYDDGSYEVFKRSGLQMGHKCGVRACVNPDHLKPQTKYENLEERSFGVKKTDAERSKQYRLRKKLRAQQDIKELAASIHPFELYTPERLREVLHEAGELVQDQEMVEL